MHPPEKICDLPGKLSIVGAPAGSAARAGDLAYFAPWGDLALFYKDFGYSSGLIILEKIDSDIRSNIEKVAEWFSVLS